MPFLHEENGSNGNVTLTPTTGVIDITSRRFNSSGGPSRDSNSKYTPRVHNRDFLSPSSSSSKLPTPPGSSQSRKLTMAKLLQAASGGSLRDDRGLGLSALQGYQRSQLSGSGNNSLNSPQNNNNHDQNDPMFVSSRRARSNNFTLKETFDLLKIWASPEIQFQMKHNFRNFRVWEAISYSMHEMGHERTAIQCKNRIQNLTSIFYRIKKSKQDYRSFNFPYYKLIGEILDGKKNGGGSSSAGNLPPGLAAKLGAFADNGMSLSPPEPASNSGFAAHLALVEEYQHLINGNPEMYMGGGGEGVSRNSSGNSNSGLSVLSPEVSLSEGNSPIRMEPRGSGGAPLRKNGSSKSPPPSFNSAKGNSLKIEHEESMTVTAEDPSLRSDIDHENINDLDEMDEGGGMRGDEEEGGFLPPRSKRSYSNAFGGLYNNNRGPSSYLPAKRGRGVSSSTNSGLAEDPLSSYLSEMIEIERQFLDLERERAENERHTMMYFMQILQALISPGQQQEEETENEGEGDENPEGEGGERVGEGGDGEDGRGEGEEPGDNEDSVEIHKMIRAEMDTGSEGTGKETEERA